MNEEAIPPGRARQCPGTCGAAARIAIVVLGIILAQAILYGPSLVGNKVLLPLDLLAEPNFYLPKDALPAGTVPHDSMRRDPIVNCEPGRQFVVAEVRAGRWPLWDPYQYAGSPVTWPTFSPFWLLSCCSTAPVILAWLQLTVALVAGLGTYAFCRQVLAVRFWPAAFAAWCFPLTGSFILWQGFILPYTIAWLPWMLLAVDQAVRRTTWWAMPGLAAATFLTLVSGQIDIAGQVLLASGIYGVWCVIDRYWKEWRSGHAARAVLTVTAGWVMGFLLASPSLLPRLEYMRTGSRMIQRGEGKEERPPVGLDALPQIVLPEMYGSTQTGSLPFFPKNQESQMESSAAAYAGLLATLLVAPLAWCSRRRRSINILWIVLAVISLTWTLDLPGIAVLRLPGLNMMSHNRFVFAASFAVLAMAAVGLDELWQGNLNTGRWFWLPFAVVVALGGWCVYRSLVPFEEVDLLENVLRNGTAVRWVKTLAQAHEVRSWFAERYLVAAVMCGLAAAGWLIIRFQPKVQHWFGPILGLLMAVELLWFAYGRSAQCDPSLYYPRIPLLEEVAASAPGRIVGCDCLPATLNETHRLYDVRGYDGVDPARFVNLMAIAADAKSLKLDYAAIQWFIPKGGLLPLRVHPVLDMLGVRYLILRGSPNPGVKADLVGNDYWVLISPKALPRVYVPEQVETVADDKQQLARLASERFDPRKTVLVETPLDYSAPCLGTAEIVDEIPTRVTVSIKMQTPGVVVLADRWDKGWKAYLDGRNVPILRVNHALRGVPVAAAEGTLEFRYEPASLTWGCCLAALSFAVCLGWAAAVAWFGGAKETNGNKERWPLESLPKSNPVKTKEKRSRGKRKSK
jgi:hypothetical protein